MTPPLVCVVDASVAIKLYLAEPLAAEAHRLFTYLADPATIFHVPDLFYIESANILRKQIQKGNCTLAQATSHYAGLSKLPLQRTPTFDLAADALTIAADQAISAYDACYVELGRRHGVSVITADEKLVKKLAGYSVPVIWLGSWTPPAVP